MSPTLMRTPEEAKACKQDETEAMWKVMKNVPMMGSKDLGFLGWLETWVPGRVLVPVPL